MLTVDKSQRGNTKQWCKFCNAFVPNNPKCIDSHNKQITHQVNVKKYEKAKRQERVSDEHKQAEIDGELERIRTAAHHQYLKQYVQGEASASRRSEQLRQQEEYEMARELYGDEVLQEIMEPKAKINKVEAYNQFMRSLPTKIGKKYRTEITELKE
jgi:hypothetical protein